MLDGRYRQALDDIERHLQDEDPDFAARMSTPVDERPFPTLPILGASLYIALPLVALLFGRTATLLTLSLGATAIAGVLLYRRLYPA
ncbi:hypothetical protein BJ973_006637 [Actinoplanes tereljensis]|uniref:DUF3040 domain-containing protein n=1 Tax=Paractinoplanes tereljensis TaxID=571912 RepID=A0A919NKM3_9ACTN|nr:DUF3040 domain-containing protein [Actinoplanes tereljensis]GIF19592.1 hypothetical protein Ate02nite_23220 [Actinoplanes tereljensis]